jgi:hypothetical protein
LASGAVAGDPKLTGDEDLAFVVVEGRAAHRLVVGDEAVELVEGGQGVGLLESPVDGVDHRRVADQRRLGDEPEGVPVVDGGHPATGEGQVLHPPVEMADDVRERRGDECRSGGPRGVVDPLGAGSGAREVEAEVMGRGPQVVDHRLAEPAADRGGGCVGAGRFDEVAQRARHAAANSGVVPVGGVAVAMCLDGEPAVAEHERTGERRRSRHTCGDEVGLHAGDRRQPLLRRGRCAMHLGDDPSTVGQIEADDDADPGFVEPGGDDGHGQRGRNGTGELVGHRHGIARPEDRLDHPGHPPGVRVRDQLRQLVHDSASSHPGTDRSSGTAPVRAGSWSPAEKSTEPR